VPGNGERLLISEKRCLKGDGRRGMRNSFDKLLLYIGFTLSLFAMLTVAGMMLLRLKKPLVERPYKTVGFPITPILFILGNLWTIVFCIKGHPMVTLYAAGTIIIGSLVYGYFTKMCNKTS